MLTAKRTSARKIYWTKNAVSLVPVKQKRLSQHSKNSKNVTIKRYQWLICISRGWTIDSLVHMRGGESNSTPNYSSLRGPPTTKHPWWPGLSRSRGCLLDGRLVGIAWGSLLIQKKKWLIDNIREQSVKVMFTWLAGQNKFAHNRKKLHQENVCEVAITI